MMAPITTVRPPALLQISLPCAVSSQPEGDRSGVWAVCGLSAAHYTDHYVCVLGSACACNAGCFWQDLPGYMASIQPGIRKLSIGIAAAALKPGSGKAPKNLLVAATQLVLCGEQQCHAHTVRLDPYLESAAWSGGRPALI